LRLQPLLQNVAGATKKWCSQAGAWEQEQKLFSVLLRAKHHYGGISLFF